MDNPLSITLNQGLQFRKYRNKITSRYSGTIKPLTKGYVESFVSSSNSGSSANASSSNGTTTTGEDMNDSASQTQEDLNSLIELKKLKMTFNGLLQQYKATQASISTMADKYIERSNTKSPYANTNVQLKNGALGYVTGNGVYKWYSSWDVVNNTAGKNGCPVLRSGEAGDYTAIEESTDSYNVPGTIINTDPPLIVGEPMKSGQSCGNEGSNVYVTDTALSSDKYIGCFKDTGSRAMTMQNDGYVFDYNSCKQRAADTNSTYFAMQDFQSNLGLAQCFVSNDYNKTTKYGSADNYSTSTLWSTGAGSGTHTMMLTDEGNIRVYDSAGKILSDTMTASADCKAIVPSNIVATWGGNVDGIEDGNSTGYVNKYNTGATSFSYTVGKGQSDPAKGKKKAFDASYNCKDKLKTLHVNQEAHNRVVTFDCSDQPVPCKCYIILKDDGKVGIYKGETPDNNTGTIYEYPVYDVSASAKNPDWEVTNGKTGKNWLASGTGLNGGEWISSNDGKLRLLMDSGGELIIQTSKFNEGCPVRPDGKAYGGGWANSVYAFDTPPNNAALGKLGYVDESGALKPYPSNMIKYSKTYKKYTNYDSSGNDLQSAIENSSADACKAQCDANDKCGGFVFNSTNNNCILKNTNTFPKSARKPYSGADLYVRNPKASSTTSCTDKTVEIDSNQWNNYIRGNYMTSKDQCGLGKNTSDLQAKLKSIGDQLNSTGKQIVDKINALQKKKVSLNAEMVQLKQQIDADLGDYASVNKQSELKLTATTTTDSMLNDSDTIVLQENYRYLFLSIFAVGVVVAAMNVSKPAAP